MVLSAERDLLLERLVAESERLELLPVLEAEEDLEFIVSPKEDSLLLEVFERDVGREDDSDEFDFIVLLFDDIEV